MKFRLMWAGVATAALLVTGACSSSESADTNGKAPAAATAAAVTNELTVVYSDNKFDKTAWTVKSGEPVTVNFQNKGQALHNWHVQGTKSTEGKDIKSELIANGKTETIKFTIDKPGTYDVLCDVHPAEMRGKLTVQ